MPKSALDNAGPYGLGAAKGSRLRVATSPSDVDGRRMASMEGSASARASAFFAFHEIDKALFSIFARTVVCY